MNNMNLKVSKFPGVFTKKYRIQRPLRRLQIILISTVLAMCLSSIAWSAPGDISTIAGRGLGDNGPATSAGLLFPSRVALDAAGNVYIADSSNNRVRKVTTSGVISTFAGAGLQTSSGDGGQAASAGLNGCSGVAVDLSGNIYIADTYNHRIRKVNSSGVITTFAGIGSPTFSGDGGQAASAGLNSPINVAVDSSGNVYIADSSNNRIRQVDNAGVITTFAGTGASSFSGDGGQAASASLNAPQGITVDLSNNVYIADTNNNRIRKVNAGGVINTIAGLGSSSYSGDGGQAISAELNLPSDVSLYAGNIYIADSGNNRIRRVDATGVITTYAGMGTASFSGDYGPAISAGLSRPMGVTVDTAGFVYISDASNNRIRKVISGDVITTLAGTDAATFSGDGGAAVSAGLNLTVGVAVDLSGNVYVADTVNNRIRKTNTAGVITTFAGNGIASFSGDGGQATSAGLCDPFDVAVDVAGNVYIADYCNSRIRKVNTSGVITTYAGNGAITYSGEGLAISNSLNSPTGVAVDLTGNVYIADTSHHRIRKVTTGGVISTIAGDGISGFAGDGGTATSAHLKLPSGVKVDSAGNVFIADSGNNRIRKINTSGFINTVAGNGTAAYSGDNGPATSASLNLPNNVAVDPFDNLYIADTFNNRIRKVNASGDITTLAGIGAAPYSGDGGPAISASLSGPYGVAVDSSGNVFIADTFNNRVRKVIESLPPVLTSVHLLSNNANTAWAKTGNIVTLTMVSSEPITPPTVAIAGHTVTSSGTGTNWSAVYTMAAGDTEGNVGFAISGYADSVGNTGALVNATTDGSTVTFAGMAPTLTTVHIASNGGNAAYAKVNDTITLTVIASANITQPTVTVAGHAASVSGTAKNWSASYTMSSGDAEGVVTFSASNFADTAGNNGVPTSVTTDSSGVTFDKTIPAVNAGTSKTEHASFTQIATATDTNGMTYAWTKQSGPGAITFTPPDQLTTNIGANADGTYVLRMTATDFAGNAAYSEMTLVWDSVTPVLTTIHIASNGGNPAYATLNDIVTVSMTVSEITMTPQISINGHIVTTSYSGGTSWSGSYQMQNSDPDANVSFVISGYPDLAGNGVGNFQNGTTDGSSVSFNKTGPSVKSFIVPASHRTLTVPVIRLTASDDVSVAGYMITEISTQPSVTDANWSLTPPSSYPFAANGSKTLYAWVKDGSGNISAPVTASIVVGLGQQLIKTSVAAGWNRTAALKSDGTVASWGSVGLTIPKSLSDIVAISAGQYYTMALKSNGTVTIWSYEFSSARNQIPGTLANVTAIAAGADHAAALTSDGKVQAWGNNDYNQVVVPTGLSGVIAIAAGESHTVALKSDGTVVAWGSPSYGKTTVPSNLLKVVAIAAGGNHTVALQSDGTVAAWGWSYYGQTAVPPGLSGVVAIAAGANHTVALKSDGTVVAWGLNSTVPTGMSGVVSIAAGESHTAVLKSDGTIAAWGNNDYGQTAISNVTRKVLAMAVGDDQITGDYHLAVINDDNSVTAWGTNQDGQASVPVGLKNVLAISAGDSYTEVLTSDGTVTVWGSGSSQLAVPAGLANVVQLTASTRFAAALKSDGTIEAWGDNTYGQTAGVIGQKNVVEIAAGCDHMTALKSDGTVTAWGYNNFGEATVPEGLSDVVAIAAGCNNSVALKSDGTIVVWGANSAKYKGGLNNVVAIAAPNFGIAALVSNGTVSVPQGRIPTGLDNVVAITASSTYGTMALRSDGTIVTWGDDPGGYYGGYSESSYQLEQSSPQINRFQPAVFSAKLNVPILAFTAFDDTAIAGYMITESPVAPLPGDSGWTVTPPAFFTVSGEGYRSLHAWVKDTANNIITTGTITVPVDTSAPSIPGIPTDAGAYSSDPSITFNWAAASDVETGIASYNLQVGTTSGGNDLFNGNVGNGLTHDVAGLHNQTLYARVQAVNGAGTAGNWSAFSDGILIDTTPPTSPGTPTDAGLYSSSATVTFNWTAGTDLESGIASYNLMVGTTPTSGDVYNGNVGNVLTTNITGTNGQTLYAHVQAVNNVGQTSLLSDFNNLHSDGILIDTVPPTTPGTPIDGGAYVSCSSFQFSWAPSSDPLSGLNGYNIQIGTTPTGNDIYSGFIGIDPYFSTNCVHGQTLYARVQAIDNAGNVSTWSPSSSGTTIDNTPPTAPGKPMTSSSLSTSTTVTFTWAPATDPESGISKYHLYIGSTSSPDMLGDIYDHDIGTATSYTLLNAPQGGLWAHVYAVNGVGMASELSLISDGIIVDNLAPVSRTVTPNTVWTNKGPFGGTITAIVPSPNQATDHTIFTATYGGLFKSIDDGANWVAANIGKSSLEVYCLAISPNYATDNTIYAGTGTGLIVSTDGGATWTQDSFHTDAISSIAISPLFNASGEVYVGSYGNLYVSSNGFSNWSWLGYFDSVMGLTYSPTFDQDLTVFAYDYNGYVIVITNGEPYSYGNGLPGNLTSIAISRDFSNDQTMFAGSTSGLYRSTNKGANWDNFNSVIQIQSLVTSPTNTLYAGTPTGVYKSVNKGNTWSLRSNGIATNDIDTSVIAISPAFNSDQTLYIGSYYTGGLHRSTDASVNWSKWNAGMRIQRQTAYYAEFSPNYANDRTVFSSTSGGFNKSVDGGATWLSDDTWLNGDTAWQMALSPGFSTDHTALAVTYGGLFMTSNGGTSWAKVFDDWDVSTAAISPNYSIDQTMFFGESSNYGLYKSTDRGSTWQRSDNGMTDTSITSIAVSPDYANDSTVFAISDDGLYRSINGGADWTLMTAQGGGGFMSLSPGYVTDQTVMITGGISTDRGNTWTQVNTGMKDVAFVPVMSPNYPVDHTLFVMNTNTFVIYKSMDSGATWNPINTSNTSVQTIYGISVSPDYANDHTLFIGTDIGVMEVYDRSFAGAGTSITITGTAEDPCNNCPTSGSGVNLVEVSTDNGASWNAATDTGGGTWSSWSYTWTLPTEGDYTIKTRASDNIGYVEALDPGRQVTVDRTKPTGAIIINNNDALISNVTVTLTLSAFDSNKVQTMKFSSDGSNWSLEEPYQTVRSWRLSNGDGVKNVYVEFRDLDGNWSDPISSTITLDTTGPAVPVVLSITPTSVTQPTWTWTSGGDNGNGTYKYNLDNSNLVANGTTTIDTTFTPATVLSAGTHTLYVQERDIAGNWSATGSFAVLIDITPPSAPGRPTDAGGYSSTTTLTFNWTPATDTQSGIKEYLVSVGTTTLGNNVFNGSVGLSTSLTVTGSQGLSYYARVQAVNNALLAGAWSLNSNGIKVDTTGPSIPGNPTDGGAFISTPTVTFTWAAASDAQSGIGGYELQIGSTPGSADVFNAAIGNVLSYAVAGSDGQTLFARVQAVNNAGIASGFSGNSDGITIDLTPPSYPGTPVDSGLYSGPTVTFTWSAANDPQSGIAGYALMVGTTPGGWDVLNSMVGNVLTTSVTGTHGQILYARVLAFNGAGSSGPWSGDSDGVIVDATAPSTPGTPVDGGLYSTSANVGFSWTASTDSESGLASYLLQVGTTLNGSNVYSASVGTVLSTNITGTNGQTLYARVQAINKVGLTSAWSSASDGILIDTAAPQTTAFPAAGNYKTAQSVTLSCADVAGSGCAAIYYTTDNSAPSLASAQYLTPLNISANTLVRYFSTDHAGNTELITSSTYTIDTIFPVGAITFPTDKSTLNEIYYIQGTAADTGSVSTGVGKVEVRIYNGTYYLQPNRTWRNTEQWLLTDGTDDWILDTASVFWTNGKWYDLSARITDNAGNASYTTSRFYYYNGLPVATELSLTPTAQTILNNVPIGLSGKLTRMPDIGTDLSGLTIYFSITDPDNIVSANTASTITDQYGHYVLPNLTGFDKEGAYKIQASFMGDAFLDLSASPVKTVLVGASAGYAILIEGKIPSSDGLESHNKTIYRVYQVLKDRGFDDANISVIKYDALLPSPPDTITHTLPSKAAIMTAITGTGTFDLLNKMNNVPAPLYIIMVDHGSVNTFHIGNETISPAELDAWISTLESGLTPEALAKKRIIIDGSCYSGSFIPTLSKAGRVVITSAAANEESFKGAQETDNIRSGEFFLEEFFKELVKGYSIKSAFVTATDRTRAYTFKGGASPNSLIYNDTAVQHPLLDDDASQSGSNTLSDGTGDGMASQDLYLGYGVTNAAGNDADFLQVNPAVYLATEITTTLWGTVTNDAAVDSAWIEVRPRSMLISSGTGTTGQLSLDIDRVPMHIANSRWEATYNLFTTSGAYDIFYFTQKTGTLELSEMQHSVVYKDKAGNNAPEPFNLMSPADSAEVKTMLSLDWEDSIDPDGNSVTYTVQIATDSLFSQIAYQKEEIQDSQLIVSLDAGLKDLTTYFWRVIAVDQYGKPQQSAQQNWHFRTNNTNALTGIVSGYVLDATTGAALSGAAVHASSAGTVTSAINGAYLIEVPAGSFTLSVSAPGYIDASTSSITIASGNSLSRNLQISSVQYALSTSTSGPGSITSNPIGISCGSTCSQLFKQGTQVALSAAPSIGSSFASWSGACSGSGACTVTMDSIKSVSASFSLNSYSITVTPTPANGTITCQSPISHGNTSNCSITPDTGYHIASVTADGSSVGAAANYAFNNVTAPHSITAAFTPDTFTITPTFGSNGSVVCTPTTVNYNGTSTCVISPILGYHVATVAVDGSTITSALTHDFSNVVANHAIDAQFAINTYTVTPSPGSNGTIVQGVQIVNFNTTTSFTINPDPGYHLLSVGGCGGVWSGSNPYVTGLITADCTVSATFAINSFNVTPSPGAGGSMSPAIAQAVPINNTTSFSISPNSGYHVASVSGCGGTWSGSNPYVTGTINGDCTISATFSINTYTITPIPGGNGGITETAQIVNHGSTTTFTINPNIGYHIGAVIGCNGSLNNNIYTTGAATTDCSITATFVINTYIVTPISGANGFVTPASGLLVSYNTTTSITLTPESGYHVALVSGCSGTLNGNIYTTGPIAADCVVSASFSQNVYPIAGTTGPGGSISPANQNVNHGNTTFFILTPDVGYSINSVIGCNGSLSGVVYTTSAITSACTVTANYAINSYTVTSSVTGTGGNIGPASQNVNYGSPASCTITPSAGYHVAQISGCGGTLNTNTYDMSSVTSNCAINVSFAADVVNTYAVIPSAGANGTITPGTAQNVISSGTTTFTIIPDSGYHIATVSGCNGSWTGINPFTTAAITGNCVVTATFANSAPTIPSLASPIDSTELATLTPDLQVNPSIDTDNDALNYEYQIYSDANMTTLVASAVTLTTTWTVTPALSENTRYWWRARAKDAVSSSQWMSTASFFVNTVNDAPAGIAINSPLNNTHIASKTPILTVANAHDPDIYDTVVYDFVLASDGGFNNVVSTLTGTTSGANGLTSWTVPIQLNDNTVYYWRARARDNHNGASSWVNAAFLVNMTNEAPTAPVPSNPANGIEITTITPTLSVTNSTDADHDTLSYVFEIDTVNTFNSAYKQSSGTLPEGTNTTSWNPAPLIDNTIYYWRAKASDGLAETWSSTGSFFTNTINDPPTAPTVLNPADGGSVTVMMPTLSLNAAIDPDNDTMTYEFQVYSDFSMTSLITSAMNQGTSWIVGNSLSDNTWYFWRARATDSHGLTGPWLAPSSFMVNNNGYNDPPSITITKPAASEPVASGASYVVTWTDSDPDSNADITLGYDATGTGCKGTVIASGISENDPGNSYIWNISQLTAGTYWVYGLISDGTSTVCSYGTGPLIKTDPASIMLSVIKSGNGSGTVTSTSVGINCGTDCTEIYARDTVVTLLATPATGSLFNGWAGACIGNGSCQVSMDASKNVIATFTPDTYTYTITATSSGYGGSISPASQIVALGKTTSLSIAPLNGYSIGEVTGCNGSLTSTTYTTGPITGDCSITVSFALNSYPITASVNGIGGSISPSSQTVNYNGSTFFILTPDNGYSINTVSGCNGSLSGIVYNTGQVTSACAITATFKQNPPNGDMNNDGNLDINDALRVLRIAAGMITATKTDLAHGDVAPLVNGVPQPDGKIDIGDVILLLRKSVGLMSW